MRCLTCWKTFFWGEKSSRLSGANGVSGEVAPLKEQRQPFSKATQAPFERISLHSNDN